MQKTLKCNRCGLILPQESKFCWNCGAKNIGVVLTEATVPRNAFIVILIIVVVVGCLCSYSFYNRGVKEGYGAGIKEGEKTGLSKGYENGYSEGLLDGKKSGSDALTKAMQTTPFYKNFQVIPDFGAINKIEALPIEDDSKCDEIYCYDIKDIRNADVDNYCDILKKLGYEKVQFGLNPNYFITPSPPRRRYIDAKAFDIYSLENNIVLFGYYGDTFRVCIYIGRTTGSNIDW